MAQVEVDGLLLASEVAMYSYKLRLSTFKEWPHKEKGTSCIPEEMAKTGFFHTPSVHNPDCATCFVCMKELDGWEASDDPFDEHRKHSPNCAFVRLHKQEEDMTLEDIIELEKFRQLLRFEQEVEGLIKKFERRCREVMEEQ